MKDTLYFQGTKGNGVCMFCGKNGETLSKGRDGRWRAKRQYHVLWEKVNWFRGDDEIIGKVCSTCKKGIRYGELETKLEETIRSRV
jgi:hypothetical protein